MGKNIIWYALVAVLTIAGIANCYQQYIRGSELRMRRTTRTAEFHSIPKDALRQPQTTRDASFASIWVKRRYSFFSAAE